MVAGSGGIDVGMLQTGYYYTYNPGEIRLRTLGGDSEGYDITTENLIVQGMGYGSIDVYSAGNLTINSTYIGDTSYYGEAVSINIDPYESPDSYAFACLTAKKDVTINGNVTAQAYSWETAKAAIRIGAGTDSYDGTVTVNGDIRAEVGEIEGTLDEAEATIQVCAKNIVLNGEFDPLAIADSAEVQTDTYGLDEEPDEPGQEEYYHRAEVDINNEEDGTCLNCENRLFPMAIDDESDMEIGDYIVIEVLINDEDEQGGPLTEGSVFSYTYTGDGILIPLQVNGSIVAFEYIPPTTALFIDEGHSDENGPYSEFIDNFQYYAQDAGGKISIEPATVTITVKDYSRPPEPKPEPEPEPEPEPPMTIVREEVGFSDTLRPPGLPDIGPLPGRPAR
jgi:hypothetical protein